MIKEYKYQSLPNFLKTNVNLDCLITHKKKYSWTRIILDKENLTFLNTILIEWHLKIWDSGQKKSHKKSLILLNCTYLVISTDLSQLDFNFILWLTPFQIWFCYLTRLHLGSCDLIIFHTFYMISTIRSNQVAIDPVRGSVVISQKKK